MFAISVLLIINNTWHPKVQLINSHSHNSCIPVDISHQSSTIAAMQHEHGTPKSAEKKDKNKRKQQNQINQLINAEERRRSTSC